MSLVVGSKNKGSLRQSRFVSGEVLSSPPPAPSGSCLALGYGSFIANESTKKFDPSISLFLLSLMSPHRNWLGIVG